MRLKETTYLASKWGEILSFRIRKITQKICELWQKKLILAYRSKLSESSCQKSCVASQTWILINLKPILSRNRSIILMAKQTNGCSEMGICWFEIAYRKYSNLVRTKNNYLLPKKVRTKLGSTKVIFIDTWALMFRKLFI